MVDFTNSQTLTSACDFISAPTDTLCLLSWTWNGFISLFAVVLGIAARLFFSLSPTYVHRKTLLFCFV